MSLTKVQSMLLTPVGMMLQPRFWWVLASSRETCFLVNAEAVPSPVLLCFAHSVQALPALQEQNPRAKIGGAP